MIFEHFEHNYMLFLGNILLFKNALENVSKIIAVNRLLVETSNKNYENSNCFAKEI